MYDKLQVLGDIEGKIDGNVNFVYQHKFAIY